MCAFDEAGQISDDKGAAELRTVGARTSVRVNYTKIGLERSKGIVGNLRPCGRDDRDQRGFSGVRETDKADVGEQLEFEAKVTLPAGVAFFVFAGSLVPRLGKMLVAASATATLNDENALAGLGEVSDGFSGLFVEDKSAEGNLQDHVHARMAGAV